MNFHQVITAIAFVLITANCELQSNNDKCIHPNSSIISKNCNFSSIVNKSINKKLNCKTAFNFIKCINDLIPNLCPNLSDDFNYRMKTQLELFGFKFLTNCKDKKNFFPMEGKNSSNLNNARIIQRMISQIETKKRNFEAVSNSDDINEQEYNKPETDFCEQSNKCEPRSLHITCGYPAANPKSNPIAYCNELTHYIRCAKCKILNCKLEDNVITIRKHLNGLETKHGQKCELNKYISKISYSQTFTSTTEPEIKTISTNQASTEISDTTISNTKISDTTILGTTISDTTILDTTILDTTILDTTIYEYLSSTSVIPESFFIKEIFMSTQIEISPSKLGSNTKISTKSTTDFTSTAKINNFFEENTNTANTNFISNTLSTSKATIKKTNTDFKTKYYSTSSSSHLTQSKYNNLTSQKIGYLKINFDFLNKGSLIALTKVSDLKFKVIPRNQTDIFKGIINGAAKLDSCNGFLIDLNNHSSEFCIFSDGKNCDQGWTVSFWLKKVNSNNFDKYFFDDFKNNSNFLSIRISDSELNVKFLNKNKLWSLNQNFKLIEKEWTMFTFLWTEFEGLIVYINNKKYFYRTDFIQIQNNNLIRENYLSNMNTGLFNYAAVKIGFENFRKISECSYQNQNQSGSDNFILIDEMNILNYKLTNNEITTNYLKEYFIKLEFSKEIKDSVYLKTLDNKKSSIILSKCEIKKSSNKFLLEFNGDGNYAFLLNLFNPNILNSEKMFSFGFTIILWIKFSLNMKSFSIGQNFEQQLFFIGSPNFRIGLQGLLRIVPQQFYEDYIFSLAFKNDKQSFVKNFKINIDDLDELINSINCISIRLRTGKVLRDELDLDWLGYQVEQINDNNLPSNNIDFKKFRVKELSFTDSDSIGVLGDPESSSHFSIFNFEIRNFYIPIHFIKKDFYQSNPKISEFTPTDDKFQGPGKFKFYGVPQIVDTKYGKSQLFTNQDQKLIIENIFDSNDLNECKFGFTLKLWICFTNYNSARYSIKPAINDNEQYKSIHILSSSSKDENKFELKFNNQENRFLIDANLFNKSYELNTNFKPKLFNWYLIMITFHPDNGFNIHVNNKPIEEKFTENHNFEDSLGFFKSELMIDKISNLYKNTQSYSMLNSLEFAIYKIIQYNVIKYSEEEEDQNSIRLEEKIKEKSLDWIFYIISVICSGIALAGIAFILFIIKKRTVKGFWSREGHSMNSMSSSKNSRLCFATISSDENLTGSQKELNLELKKWNTVRGREINCSKPQKPCNFYQPKQSFPTNRTFAQY